MATGRSEEKTDSAPVPSSGAPTGLVLFGGVLLVGVVVMIFSRAWDCPFVDLDIPEQLINNEWVHGFTVENVCGILHGEGLVSYYPVRALTYAFDYHFWQLEPRGYKRTNCLLHVVNVLLVYALLLRLLAHGGVEENRHRRWLVLTATFAAGWFGWHPLVVEPVVWVAGREELLMTVGVLATVHFYLTGMQLAAAGATLGRRVLCYACAAAFCLMACLSNVVGAVTPLLLAAVHFTRSSSFDSKRFLLATWPVWVIGIGAVILKFGGAIEPGGALVQPMSSRWLKLALAAYGLNVASVVWPAKLMVYYDWPALTAFQLCFGAAMVGLTAAAIWMTERWPAIRLGLLWFVIALLPAAQLIPHHIIRADRFLYLPLVGMTLALAATVQLVRIQVRGWTGFRVIAVRGALAIVATLWLVALAGATNRQIQTWRDSITLWSHCLEGDPDNAYAHSCLADNLFEVGDYAGAFEHYRRAIDLRPDHADTLGDCGWALATCPDPRYRDFGLAVELAERACQLTDWKVKRILRKLAVVRTNVAGALASKLAFPEAIQMYRSAIEADPDFDVPRFNLALLLITCPDKTLRSAEEAVLQAEQGARVTKDMNAQRLAIQGAAYAAAGRFEDAVEAVGESIQRAQQEGDFGMIAELQEQRARYRERKPFDPSGE